MRRAVVVTALIGAASILAGTVTTAAHATYTPSTAPYNQTANNTVLTSLLDLPDTIPAAPTPTVPGYTYPPAWNEGAQVAQKARVAARAMPALRVIGTIGLAVTAFEVGWQIGTGVNHYFHLSGGVGTSGGVTGITYQWKFSSDWGAVMSSGYGVPHAPGWILDSLTANCGAEYDAPGQSHTDCSSAQNTQAGVIASTAGATTYALSPANSPRNSRVYWLGESAMEAAVSRAPESSSAYTAEPTKLSAYTYTQPTLTTTDLANARATLGAPVATRDATTGVYKDASGNPLSTGQVVAQLDYNCRIDSSYCAGGANDPTGAGGPLADTFSMPNCVGLAYAACTSALTAAGFTGTAAYTQLTLATAVTTSSAGTVITQPSPPTTTLPKTGTITFTRNPDVMPVLLPQPELNETYDQYKTRLITLGWLGVATFLALDPANADPRLGPDAPVRVRVTTTTGTQTLVPFGWPLPLPRIDPNANIQIDRNPADMAPAVDAPPVPGSGPDPGIGGSAGSGDCDCPAIDLTPLTQATPSDKFPFGVFTWLGDVLGVFHVSPVAPGFDIDVSASVGGVSMPHYEGDLSAFSGYMNTIRTMISWALWIGAVWFVGSRMLGFNAGGDLSEAADDGTVV
jgi:hypothetical protein